MKEATCTVCLHADRDEIERAMIEQSAPERAIARQFHLKHDALRRHRLNHLAGTLAQAQAQIAVRQAAALVPVVAGQMHSAQSLLALANRTLTNLAALHDACYVVLVQDGKLQLGENGEVSDAVSLAASVYVRATGPLHRSLELVARALASLGEREREQRKLEDLSLEELDRLARTGEWPS